MSINAQTLTAGIKKYPILLGAGLISLALILVLYFRSGLQEAKQAELDKYSSDVARYRSNISNSAQLQEQVDFLIKANAAVKDRAFASNTLALNLQYFYRLESEVGIKYLDLRPGGKSAPIGGKGGTYVPLNYVVTIQGTFAQAITYLRHLEQGEYFCRVNTMSASGGDSSVTLNLNIDLLGIQ
ncbi:MAG: hypothetical protein WC205_11230 [Opitutaceae bacterium]|jgi:hypothetical protein